MKLNFCILSILFTVIIFAINPTLNAQSDDFKTYTNKEMNFGIQYPSNWGKPEYENFEPETILSVVYFDNFQVAMEEVGEPYLDTGTMTVKNISLEQRVQKELNNHASSANEKIIRH